MSERVKVGVMIPQVPNFLRMSDGQGSIPIADVTDAELRRLGKRWTEALVQTAKNRRKQRTEVSL